jgi:hypothetical protein
MERLGVLCGVRRESAGVTMTIDELVAQYDRQCRFANLIPTWHLKTFLEGLEQMGAELEEAEIVEGPTDASNRVAGYLIVIVTSRGPAVVHIDYEIDREETTLTGHLYGWQSVTGVQLTGAFEPRQLNRWRLEVGAPKLTVADRDEGRTLKLAGAIFGHLSTREG